MAFTDNTTGGRILLQGIGPLEIALSADAKPGDLIGISSSGTWVLADGNSSPNVQALLVAGQAGASGDTIRAYSIAVVGNFSGASKGDRVWLSDTAGRYSATASTTLAQQVGIALSATEALIAPHLFAFTPRVNEKRATVSADTTLDVATDNGVVQMVDTDAKTITLPATVVGIVYTIENAGADGAVLVTISPNASDKIMGMGSAASDNKDILNTKATARRGDRVVLVGDGVDGWKIASMTGVWAREA